MPKVNYKKSISSIIGFMILMLSSSVYSQCDTTNLNFGNAGYIQSPIGSDDQLYQSLRTENGIISVGYATVNGIEQGAIVYQNFDGSPMVNFGNSGKVTIGNNANLRDVKISPDGKIVAAGFVDLFFNDNFFFVRLLENGSRDPDFGVNGAGTTYGKYPDATINKIESILITPNNKISAIGSIDPDLDNERDVVYVSLTPEGAYDTSFSEDGMANNTSVINSNAWPSQTTFDGTLYLRSIFISAADGKDYSKISARSYDPTISASIFDGVSSVSLSLPNTGVFINGAKKLPNGKIVAYGYESVFGFAKGGYLAIFDEDGKLDESFFNLGYRTFNDGLSIMDVILHDDYYYILAFNRNNGESSIQKIDESGSSQYDFNGSKQYVIPELKYAKKMFDIDGEAVISGTRNDQFCLFGFNLCELSTTTSQPTVDDLSIFPNPIQENQIYFSKPYTGPIIISDLAGNIKHRAHLNQQSALKIEDLTSGVFLIKFAQQTIKFIVP